ncbi:MAG: response regulator [Planctomycetes bacterium]|jgi:DNA-binding response OmpR family regulator|nr:response regulator [Planctomycetota bacterium]
MGATILVADDEPFILRSLSFVLRKEGHEVLEARDGAEALSVARTGRPRIVFLDVMMPMLNGYEVLERIRKEPDLAGVHVILLTAKGQEADRQRGLDSGADEYLTKPFSPSRITERVREILSGESACQAC